MAGYFLDTSAVVKRYVRETGTSWIRGLTRPGQPDTIDIARITTVELTSAVARRGKGGNLDARRIRSILSRFGSHVAGQYIVAEITPALLASAAKLANSMHCGPTTPCNWLPPWNSTAARKPPGWVPSR